MDLISLALFMLVILLIVAANLGERSSPVLRIATYGGAILMGLGSLGLGVLYLLAAFLLSANPEAFPESMQSLAGMKGMQVGLWLLVGGIVSWIVLLPPMRRLLARILPIRPESTVNALALALLALLWAQSLGLAGLGPEAFVSLTGRLTVAQVLVSEVPLAVMGIVGVGFLIRRIPSQTWQRLGLQRLTLRQGLVTLGVLLGLLLLQAVVSALARWIAPQAFTNLEEATSELYAGLGLPWAAVLASLASGTAEEILFRGALQPRLGLVLTALTFAIVHAQYGLLFALASIGVVAVALGLVRRYINTTACIAIHVLYNLILFIWSA